MDGFLELLRLGATSPDNAVREANEHKLIEYREKDPIGLSHCMNAFGNDAVDAALRAIAGTMFKVSIANENVGPRNADQRPRRLVVRDREEVQRRGEERLSAEPGLQVRRRQVDHI